MLKGLSDAGFLVGSFELQVENIQFGKKLLSVYLAQHVFRSLRAHGFKRIDRDKKKPQRRSFFAVSTGCSGRADIVQAALTNNSSVDIMGIKARSTALG